jgi:CoA:oxalate CoA-transferase
MMDSVIVLLDNLLARYCLDGKVPAPVGNRHPVAVPFCPFTCEDRNQVIVGISTDEQWSKFCTILGHQEWINAPEYATFAARSERGPEVEAKVADVLKHWESAKLCDALEEQGLVYAQINNVAQVVHHPQT